MQNGYALASEDQLRGIADRLATLDAVAAAALQGRYRVAVQRDVAVTIGGSENVVSQAYCAALPVAYCAAPPEMWEPFAPLVLRAAYEATLWEGLLNRARTGSPRVFLTKLGGGAFGNRTVWIVEAIRDALAMFESSGLDVRIVSYSRSDADIRPLLR
jgi:hypothetical protein